VDVVGLLLLVGGVALVAFTFADALWTTLWPEGAAGPLTSRLSTLLWQVTHWLTGPDQHRLLNLAGPIILFTTVVAWVVLVAAGWTMVFSAEAGALLEVRTREPADFVGRIYFVLYSIFTLGNGDYVPQGGVYQLATAGTVASGMFLITLAITYLLSVISAVADKRAFASHVSGFGQSPEEIVLTAWDGTGFDGIGPPLAQLTSSLGLLAEQHQAYPILHYYHPINQHKASAVAIMNLDEALMIMEQAVTKQYKPRPAELQPARQSVTSYLETLVSAFIAAADHPPSPPDLDKLREKDVPVVSDEYFANVLEQHDDRRRMLLGLLANDGWTDKGR
jgi:hypothetical protein